MTANWDRHSRHMDRPASVLERVACESVVLEWEAQVWEAQVWAPLLVSR
jgi:hypothetical protein